MAANPVDIKPIGPPKADTIIAPEAKTQLVLTLSYKAPDTFSIHFLLMVSLNNSFSYYKQTSLRLFGLQLHILPSA